jgi:hypothetical protein
LQRQAEAIEAGPEVGGAGRHPHHRTQRRHKTF